MTTGDRQRYLATINMVLELTERAQPGDFHEWCRFAEPVVANSRHEELRDLLWFMSGAMAERAQTLAGEQGISFDEYLRKERLDSIEKAEADLDE